MIIWKDIFNPTMNYTYIFHDRIMKEIFDFDFLNLDCESVVNQLKNNLIIKKLQTFIGVKDGIITTDEEDLEDADTVIPKTYNYRLIKLFENRKDFYPDDYLKNLFFDFNSKIKNIKGVEYVHVHSMPYFIHPTHIDGNLVMMVNLKTPINQNEENFGLKVADRIYQPRCGEVFWLETNLPHSAWNFSNIEWKFLTISIDRNFVS